MAPPTTSGPVRLQPALDEALKRATRSRLETMLRSICASHPEALKDVESALVNSSKAGHPKRPRYAVCVNPGCGAEFDVAENDEEDCSWHPGELEIDDDADFFADHDENCNTEWHQKEYPEGFMWNCCEENAVSSATGLRGCETGPHEEDSGDVKRRR